MTKNFLSYTVLFVVMTICLFLQACSTDGVNPPNETPQDEYAIDALTDSEKGAYELNMETLEGIVTGIEEGNYGNIHSLVIIQNDGLVLEEYFQGWTRHMRHPCFSVTKSFTSALIGIAIEQGYIGSVDEELLGFFPEYDDLENPDERKESITLESVLSMTSGFEWNEANVFENGLNGLRSSTDWIEYTLELPMASENTITEFNYNTAATHLLSGVLENTTGQSAAAFAEENLFAPMGVTGWHWLTDYNGLYNTGGFFGGLHMHPVDMAMFGYLYLNNGRLNGEQIVPESWVQQSVAGNITAYNLFEYGYLWWRFADWYYNIIYKELAPSPQTNDIFRAYGFGGQLIYVIPHLDMVIVITGWDPLDPGEMLNEELFQACLGAVQDR